MCGIVYVQDFNGESVNNEVLNRFDAQRHRGTEGFGLFDGQEMNMVRAANENKILKWLVKYDSNLVMFHHRNPTSTINVRRAAHPFSTKGYFGNTQYVLVHNGHISNSWSLNYDHEKLGITYQSELDDGTFNDSESLLWDLALTLEGKQEELKAYGQIAFICMKIVDGALDKMYFGRNYSPLKMKRDKNRLILSSEGDGEDIEPQKLYTYNYKLNRLTSKDFDIPSTKAYVPTYSGTTYTPKYSAEEKTQNWLPEWLRKKYGVQSQVRGVPTVDYDRDGNPIEYESYDDYVQTQTGIYVPRSRDYDEEEFDELLDDTAWEIYEDMSQAVNPAKGEVESTAFDYLKRTDGNFERAFSLCEWDYMQTFSEDGTPPYDEETIYQSVLLEKVMWFLECDPEYVNEKSVSSYWRSICSQQQLV